MIVVIEGKGVGSGKSYMVIEYLMEHWLKGGTAYISESFVVLWDNCKKYAWERWGLKFVDAQYNTVKSGDIYRLHEHTAPGTEECPVLIVVDEGQDQLDVREFGDKAKKDLFSWLCQSRHDDNDVLFVSQSAKNLDSRIRRLATFTWSIRNAKNFTIQGLGNLASLIRFSTLGLNSGFYFIRNQLDYDGRTSIDTKWRKADPRLFQCYKSKSMANSRKRLGAAVARFELERRKGTKPMYKWLLLGGIAVMISGCWTIYQRGGVFKVLDENKAKAPAVSSSSLVPSAFAGPKPSPTTLYDLRREPWVQSAPNFLKTKSGLYQVGRMSADGMVMAIKDKVVRVTTPAGRTLYIIGEDWTVPSVPIVIKEKPPGQIVVVGSNTSSPPPSNTPPEFMTKK